MIHKNRQYGFSLLEVMMAVVVLTMGMVFIASMFPVGLYNARKTVDATMNAIELNNSIVSSGLEIEAAINAKKENLPVAYDRSNCFEFREAPYNLDKWNNNDNNYDSGEEGNPNSIHFLIKPNVLANSYGTNNPVVVVDDIEFAFYNGVGSNGYSRYSALSQGVAAGIYRGASHFIVSIYNKMAYANLILYGYIPTYIPPFIDGSYASGYYYEDSTLGWLSTASFRGDISYVASPPVNYLDQDVLNRIIELEGSIAADELNLITEENVLRINQAVYDVAMERNYSWSAFYEGSYPFDASGNQGKPEYMYIFILKNHQRDVRYAVQDSTTMRYYDPVDPIFGVNTNPSNINDFKPIGGLPAMLGAGHDRHLPVPWLVHLNKPVVNLDYYELNSNVLFNVDKSIADLLRPGSVILDADPIGTETRNGVFLIEDQKGLLFEVTKVEPVNPANVNTSYNVYFNRPLAESTQKNCLFTFWVFPPAINRSTGQFEDDQPVVNVVYRKLDVE